MSSEDNRQPAIPSSSSPPLSTYHPARENMDDRQGSDGDDDSDMDYSPEEEEVEYFDAESTDGSMPGLLGRLAPKT